MEYATGTRDLKKLGGLSHKMPVTGATQFIGAMSVSGVPPFNGFWSKLHHYYRCRSSRQDRLCLLGGRGQFFNIRRADEGGPLWFSGPLKAELAHIKEVPILMRLPMEVLALGCVLGGGLLIPGIRELFLDQAVNVILHGKNYMHLVLQHFI